jgi:hypothetical protein
MKSTYRQTAIRLALASGFCSVCLETALADSHDGSIHIEAEMADIY